MCWARRDSRWPAHYGQPRRDTLGRSPSRVRPEPTTRGIRRRPRKVRRSTNGWKTARVALGNWPRQRWVRCRRRRLRHLRTKHQRMAHRRSSFRRRRAAWWRRALPDIDGVEERRFEAQIPRFLAMSQPVVTSAPPVSDRAVHEMRGNSRPRGSWSAPVGVDSIATEVTFTPSTV